MEMICTFLSQRFQQIHCGYNHAIDVGNRFFGSVNSGEHSKQRRHKICENYKHLRENCEKMYKSFLEKTLKF